MNYLRRKRISRRCLLRGAGVAVALPYLELMLDEQALAQVGDPVRFMMMFYPNGFYMPAFKPKSSSLSSLPVSLRSLQGISDKLLYLDKLENAAAFVWEDDQFDGAHARGTATVLSLRPLPKGKIRGAQSFDQWLAAQMPTPLKSLVTGWTNNGDGEDEDGYANAYKHHISWSDGRNFTPKQTSPRQVYESLVQAKGSAASLLLASPAQLRASTLDLVKADITRLKKDLGKEDLRKLDEYLSALRQVEKDLGIAVGGGPASGRSGVAEAHCPGQGTWDAIGTRSKDKSRFKDHGRQMMDLFALAFQCDLTRVATYMGQGSFSDPGFDDFLSGVDDSHHTVSHKQGDWKSQMEAISTWEVEQFAYLCNKLDGMKSPTGKSLLDQSILCFTSEFGDGDDHDHKNIPMLIAGKGGGALQTGRYLKPGLGDGRFGSDYTSFGAVYLAIAKAMGLSLNKFGKVPQGMDDTDDYKGKWREGDKLEDYATQALDEILK